MEKKTKATLSEEESRSFFHLFLSILASVNLTYEIVNVSSEQLLSGRVNKRLLKKIADFLWGHPSFVDDYLEGLAEQADLRKEDRELFESWRHPVTGRFVVERHQARGSILIDIETGKVYLVKGITDTWREMLRGFELPVLIEGTLLPFRGCIISDGLISVSGIPFGPKEYALFTQMYMKAKENGCIVTSLEAKP